MGHASKQPTVACTDSGEASALRVEPVRETQLQTRHAGRNCARGNEAQGKDTRSFIARQSRQERSSKTTAHPVTCAGRSSRNSARSLKSRTQAWKKSRLRERIQTTAHQVESGKSGNRAREKLTQFHVSAHHPSTTSDTRPPKFMA